MTLQVYRREKFLRDMKAKQRREVAQLEKRWQRADDIAQEVKEEKAEAAHKRVQAWDARKASSRNSVVSTDVKRTQRLAESLQVKDERLGQWRVLVEEEETRKREEHAQTRLAAGQRFAQGLRTREFRLQAAEERVAQRAGILAAKMRRELAERREQAEIKAQAALTTRLRVEGDLHERIRQIESKGREKAQHVDDFLTARREEHDKKVEAKRQQQATPRGGATASPRDGSRPTSARGTGGGGATTPRGRAAKHEGVSGLEAPMLKCALCEQSFSHLTGCTFLKAVAQKRADFGDDALLKWVQKRGLVTMYESASLCCFCCQFFAEGWRD